VVLDDDLRGRLEQLLSYSGSVRRIFVDDE